MSVATGNNAQSTAIGGDSNSGSTGGEANSNALGGGAAGLLQGLQTGQEEQPEKPTGSMNQEGSTGSQKMGSE